MNLFQTNSYNHHRVEVFFNLWLELRADLALEWISAWNYARASDLHTYAALALALAMRNIVDKCPPVLPLDAAFSNGGVSLHVQWDPALRRGRSVSAQHLQLDMR